MRKRPLLGGVGVVGRWKNRGPDGFSIMHGRDPVTGHRIYLFFPRGQHRKLVFDLEKSHFPL
jgi:hypothetical protein